MIDSFVKTINSFFGEVVVTTHGGLYKDLIEVGCNGETESIVESSLILGIMKELSRDIDFKFDGITKKSDIDLSKMRIIWRIMPEIMKDSEKEKYGGYARFCVEKIDV